MKFGVLSKVVLLSIVVTGMAVSACSSSKSGGSSGSGDSSPIKIGVLQDKSGIVAASSAKAIEGLKVAVDAINNGEYFWAKSAMSSSKTGIMGRKVELVYEDTQANPNQALLATRKLASQKVAAVIGTTTSPDAIQAKVACEQAKLPCIFASVSAAAIVAPPNNGYAFTLAPSFDVQATEVANALKAAKISSISIVQDDSGTANTVAASFTKAFAAASIPIASTEVIPTGAQDATSQVQRVKSKNPGAVLDLVVPVSLNTIFVKQLRSAFPSVPLFGINTLVEPTIVSQLGEALSGAIAIDQFDRSQPDVAAFAAYSKKLNSANQEIGSTQLYMATAVLIMKHVMEKANSTSGDAVKGQLESLTGFPAGFGQRGYTVNWTAANHNGSGAGGVVFVQFAGTKAETWKTYQPSASK